MILTQRDLLAEARALAAQAERERSSFRLEIERLKLQLEKARRARFGQISERGRQIVEQLELAIADLEETQAEVETTADITEAPTPSPRSGSDRRKPARRPLPDHLPRERVVHPSPCACRHCGSSRLRKLGEIITESLECEPRRWKVVQHVRETVTCRDCEGITETPAPSHPIARGRAGPHLLALVLAGKYAQHLPLNRQSEIYAREGAAIEVSTLADWVGACAASLQPIVARIRAHVFAAVRGVAIGRANWTFAGSDAGGQRAAAIYTLTETCKLNGVDPQAWLAEVLARLPAHPAKQITELLPWNRSPPIPAQRAA